MKRDDRSPEHYRHSVHGVQRQMLEAIREVILEMSPGIEECIANGMLRYPGLGWLAAQKDFVALYLSAAVVARHKRAFDGLDCGKSCMRFRHAGQLDDAALRVLIEDAVSTG